MRRHKQVVVRAVPEHAARDVEKLDGATRSVQAGCVRIVTDVECGEAVVAGAVGGAQDAEGEVVDVSRGHDREVVGEAALLLHTRKVGSRRVGASLVKVRLQVAQVAGEEELVPHVGAGEGADLLVAPIIAIDGERNAREEAVAVSVDPYAYQVVLHEARCDTVVLLCSAASSTEAGRATSVRFAEVSCVI